MNRMVCPFLLLKTSAMNCEFQGQWFQILSNKIIYLNVLKNQRVLLVTQAFEAW